MRDKLKLSSEVAAEIEEEALKPRREFEENRQRYKYILMQATRRENPLSQTTRESLKHLQQVRGLRDEDVADVEAQVSQRRKPVVRSTVKPVSTSSSNLLVLLGGTAAAVLTGVLVFIFSRQMLSGDQTTPSVILSPSASSSVSPDTPDSSSPNPSVHSSSPSSIPESQLGEAELLQRADDKSASGDYSGAIKDYEQVI